MQKLKPALYNPRKWNEQQKAQLRESIDRFGFVDPILVNGAKGRKNIVIGGHFRLEVAKEVGMETVPVVYVDILDREREKELNLRLNRNTGSWDYDVLREMDIDLLLDVGFNDSDLSVMWDEQLGVETDGFDVKNEIEQITNPDSQIGEVYELGRHRLVCGDATDSAVLKQLMGKKKADMLYCDPPYNLNYDYQKGLGTEQRYACGTVDDKRTDEEYALFLQQTIQNGLAHAQKNTHVFYYCDQKYIGTLQGLYRKHGIENKRVCLWIKNNQNVTPKVAFNKCYEPCVYGTRGTPYLSDKSLNFTEVLNPEVGTGNRTLDDIGDLIDIWLVKRLPTSEYLHPTEKPVTLHERPLKRCTKAGDIILDLFGGSGSTLVACEQLGRTAYLVEKDPIFCDIIRKRFAALTAQNT